MRFLITGALQAHRECAEILTDMGHRVDLLQNEKDALPDAAGCYEAVICNGLFLHHQIEEFKNLKYIQLTSAGYDRVDLEYIRDKGIRIFNAGGVYSIPMAEFAVAGVLELYKQSRFFWDNQKNQSWIKNRGLRELNGKTVCILGCGSVGTECAKRFKAFGTRVVGVDLYPREDENYVKICSLDELNPVISECDVLVLTLPLTEETCHIINSERLALLKDSAVLVNIARGGVVDTEALIKELPRLYGAVLDVFEEEPLSADSPLWNMENVIVTPHNSFVGENNSYRLNTLIINNFKEFENA
ncbi:MAG: hydroxyacid dehydrogenase [Clostridia bacterium]|nr:hydroxyacid dehydrogenase [Clostridia bacterium]